MTAILDLSDRSGINLFMTSSFNAGWLPDPEGASNTLRWWDGEQWTSATHTAPAPSQRRPKRGIRFVAGITAGVILLAMLPLMLTTIRVDGGNCGTIFASSDSWTYKSTYDGPGGYFGSSRSPEASVSAALDDLFADLDRGSDVVDACQAKHDDRSVLLYVLGGTVIALGLVSLGSWLSSRRSKAAVQAGSTLTK